MTDASTPEETAALDGAKGTGTEASTIGDSADPKPSPFAGHGAAPLRPTAPLWAEVMRRGSGFGLLPCSMPARSTWTRTPLASALVHDRSAQVPRRGRAARASLCEVRRSTDSLSFTSDQIEYRPVRFCSLGFTELPGLRSLLPQGSGGSSPLFRTSLPSPSACRSPRGASARQASLARLRRRSSQCEGAKAIAPKQREERVKPKHCEGGRLGRPAPSRGSSHSQSAAGAVPPAPRWQPATC